MKNVVFKLLCVVLSLMTTAGVAATVASAAEKMSKQSNPLYRVRVGFYGDSICAANGENRIGWAGRVGNANQMIWQNHAQGGWAISDCRGSRKNLYYQLSSTPCAEYDMVILHGGTNDAWDHAPVGSITKDFLPYNQYNPSTFAGGLERAFAYLREQNPNAVVGYIINFKFINAAIGSTTTIDGNEAYVLNNMQEYVDMTKKICEKWEIPYLDLYSNNELTAKLHPTNSSGEYLTTYLYDFIHPTSLGYDLLYPYVEQFMIDLITDSKLSEEQTTVSSDTEAKPDESPAQNTVATSESKEKVGCKANLSGLSLGVALLSGALLCCGKRKSERKKQNEQQYDKGDVL